MAIESNTVGRNVTGLVIYTFAPITMLVGQLQGPQKFSSNNPQKFLRKEL